MIERILEKVEVFKFSRIFLGFRWETETLRMWSHHVVLYATSQPFLGLEHLSFIRARFFLWSTLNLLAGDKRRHRPHYLGGGLGLRPWLGGLLLDWPQLLGHPLGRARLVQSCHVGVQGCWQQVQSQDWGGLCLGRSRCLSERFIVEISRGEIVFVSEVMIEFVPEVMIVFVPEVMIVCARACFQKYIY